MRTLLVAWALVTATSAIAQPAENPATRAPCADCGTVTTVRTVSKELRPQPADEGEPSGLVATVPLGGGPVRAGSSSRIGKEKPNIATRWEVVVRMDDGRYQLVTQDAKPGFAQGERVRVREGKLEHPPEE